MYIVARRILIIAFFSVLPSCGGHKAPELAASSSIVTIHDTHAVPPDTIGDYVLVEREYVDFVGMSFGYANEFGSGIAVIVSKLPANCTGECLSGEASRAIDSY